MCNICNDKRVYGQHKDLGRPTHIMFGPCPKCTRTGNAKRDLKPLIDRLDRMIAEAKAKSA
ncbi:hypothetical protein ABEW83_10210 [Bacillus subtilis]